MGKWCEIEGCDNTAGGTTQGIQTCERCRQGFFSCGLGVVYFGGRYHGVRGAQYSSEQESVFSGLQQSGAREHEFVQRNN